ncbi:MAG: glycerate kinase [Ginsengibacter sp.]
MMRILIAPNAFKNSLSAKAAAIAIEDGFKESKLDCICEKFAVGDGGDGTAALVIEKCGGHLIKTIVHDPLGRKIMGSFGLIDDGRTAIIEMAEASGLRLLKSEELNPLKASSAGTGELIKAALDQGVKKIMIAMGGSATVDGGIGILSALGVQFIDQAGELIVQAGQLNRLHRIETTNLDERVLNCQVIVLCDVDNKLLGDSGAAAVFGPQKGASFRDVVTLDTALNSLSKIILKQTGTDISTIKYGGTAGGAAAGLHAFINANLVNGIAYFLELTGFDKALERNDIVITGEGNIDEQTLQGKGPYGVAVAAKRKGLPIIGLAGKVPLTPTEMFSKYFDVLLPISNQTGDIHLALQSTAADLQRTSKQIGNLLATGYKLK